MNWIWILCSFISHLSHSVHSGSIWMNIVAWRCRRTVVRSEVPILIKRCWTLYGRGLNCGRSVSGLFYLFINFFGWFSLVLINSHFIQSAYFWHGSGIWTRNLLFTSVKCSELYLFCIEVHPVNSHCGGKLDFHYSWSVSLSLRCRSGSLNRESRTRSTRSVCTNCWCRKSAPLTR